MRLFWAIELPEAAREGLVRLQDALRAACPGAPVRWAGPEQLHLTLKFLGEAAGGDPLLAGVGSALGGRGPLRLELEAPGTFGGRVPRVVWCGVGGPDRAALVDLAGVVEEACGRLGFPRESRPFRPHVTLGRVGHGRGGSALRVLAEAVRGVPAPAVPPFRVEELVLFQSLLQPGRRAVYEALGRLPLRGA